MAEKNEGFEKVFGTEVTFEPELEMEQREEIKRYNMSLKTKANVKVRNKESPETKVNAKQIWNANQDRH